ncbi:aspartate dehydrogenase domain-containing protein [Paraburkholderia sp. J63]|uniref:aspartate dehydrogenase domain-containing protein n=1 Tax=Paraburkholderia sp. J63 TaxID=2805434 RepID=UPI002ABDFD88|nr:aspartate dehydrogenase domain-containing protein [Paraburkholderia sp. J63]
MKIGLIGAGKIAFSLATELIRNGHEVVFAYSRGKTSQPFDTLAVPSVQHLNADDIRSVNLMVEAASAQALHEHGLAVLAQTDLAILSTTALADLEFERAVRERGAAAGTKVHVLAGGMVGLDGAASVSGYIKSLVITTTKTPAAWGIDAHAGTQTLFEGSTREACVKYPRNVNVHAGLAYSSIGFDRCRSILVSDPHAHVLSQKVEVVSEDFGWTIDLYSRHIGGVSGSLTPRSVLGSVLRILSSAA